MNSDESNILDAHSSNIQWFFNNYESYKKQTKFFNNCELYMIGKTINFLEFCFYLSSKLLDILVEIGCYHFMSMLKMINLNNRSSDSKTFFENIDQNDEHKIFPIFKRIIKYTHKSTKNILKNQIKKENFYSSKLLLLESILSKALNEKKKIIIFISKKYILMNVKKMINEVFPDEKISIALNKKQNKNLVSSYSLKSKTH